MNTERQYPQMWLECLAGMIDGQSRWDDVEDPYRERPAVNPDRHARIRAKHFHHAAERSRTRQVANVMDTAVWERCWALSLTYGEAFTCSAWGVW